MGAELADLVPLEDVILAYPVQLTGRIVPYSFHLRKNNKIDAARCVFIVHATVSRALFRYFLLSIENSFANVEKRCRHNNISNEFFITLHAITLHVVKKIRK